LPRPPSYSAAGGSGTASGGASPGGMPSCGGGSLNLLPRVTVQPAMQDLRYAIRSLRKQPIFTLVAVLTLTLGIGANTAIFSLLYQILLRPLPYADADRLVFIWNTYPLMGLPQANVSIPDYLDRKTQATAIEDATLFTMRSLNLAAAQGQGQPEQVRGLAVTPSFFSTLGRRPGPRALAVSAGFGGIAVQIREQLVGDARAPLYVLQAGVLAVLLIACANVASLLLMRATGRARELAIRITLGAGRWRLLRQLLTEGVVLSTCGAIGGLALGLAGVRGLVALGSRQVPGMAGASLNPAVLAFATLLALVTGLVFGLVPALAVIRGNTSAVLKEDTARGSAGKRTGFTRATLVIVETALALVLLVGAGLLIKSFARLQAVNPGFSTENVLTAQIGLPPLRYADPAARRAFWTRLVDKARALPGVTAAGL